MILRRLLEQALTKQDYFHQPHVADPAITDPTTSYYYDVRARAYYSGAFDGTLPVINYGPLRFTNPIHAAQFGLGHFQLYWDTNDIEWLDRGLAIARQLMESGRLEGSSLVWRYPLEIRGAKNWLSAMAQGQVASFLLRAATLSSDTELMEGARAALAPFLVDINSGGVQTALEGRIWFEEYAFEPIPYTLNGFIVALLGLYDSTLLLRPIEAAYQNMYELGLQTLLDTLPRFDANNWSRYDLSTKSVFRVPLRNLASPFYHRFHIELLDIMFRLTNNTTFCAFQAAWARSLVEGPVFYSATAEKVLFRAITSNPASRAKVGEV